MGRSKGAKDQSKRVRRTSTEAEKKARSDKKARIEQRNAEVARARARASFFNPPPVVVPGEGATPPEEPELLYTEVQASDCHGTMDLGEIAAAFDDDYKLAMKWIDSVDGVSMFPKLRNQLRKYHKL
jgi:hypothetical protein